MSSRRILAACAVTCLGLAAALAALPAATQQTTRQAAQQTVDQPVYRPPAASRIETSPLPPIGGNPAAERITGDTTEGTGGDDTGGALRRPRFLRVPSTGDGQGGSDAGQQERNWERSPDGRFHRAPQREVPSGSETPAPLVPIDPPATDLRAGARLRELDKMTGHTKTFEIGVGQARQVDRLRIELAACRSPEGNDMHGTMAFLKVWDTKHPNDEAFSGWMFAESPALSALDHPRYDLWVISCTTSAAATSASRQ